MVKLYFQHLLVFVGLLLSGALSAQTNQVAQPQQMPVDDSGEQGNISLPTENFWIVNDKPVSYEEYNQYQLRVKRIQDREGLSYVDALKKVNRIIAQEEQQRLLNTQNKSGQREGSSPRR